MCVIVDTNVASIVFLEPTTPDYLPLVEWLHRRGGRIVFGGRLSVELMKVTRIAKRLRSLNQAGIALQYTTEEIKEEENAIREQCYPRSDDLHILALARVSGARILCSNDGDLEQDFKDTSIVPSPRGKVYKRAQHRRLLKHSSSCARRMKIDTRMTP
jgi:hypothetical protein